MQTNGHATIKAACFLAEWRVTAPNYLPNNRFNNSLNTEKTGFERPGFIPKDFAVVGASSKARIGLYKTPEPTILIKLPENFHGPLRVIKKNISGHAEIAKGVREFYYAARPDGWCVIPMNKLFWEHDPQIKITRGEKLIYPAKRGDVEAFCNTLDLSDTVTQRVEISLFTIGSETDFESLEAKLCLQGRESVDIQMKTHGVICLILMFGS